MLECLFRASLEMNQTHKLTVQKQRSNRLTTQQKLSEFSSEIRHHVETETELYESYFCSSDSGICSANFVAISGFNGSGQSGQFYKIRVPR